MGKYYDKLLTLSESLDSDSAECAICNNNFEMALEKYKDEGISDGDCLVKAFNEYIMSSDKYGDSSIDDFSIASFCKWLTASPDEEELYLEDGEEDSIAISTDELTDKQKKDILINDREIDKELVDGMSDEEMNGALKASSSEDEQKVSEGIEDDDGNIGYECVIRIDDDDLDKHGYIELDGADELALTDNEGNAAVYPSEELANEEIERLCGILSLARETFSIEHLEDSSLDDDKWVSIDPTGDNAVSVSI